MQELLEKAGKIEKAAAYLVPKYKEADKNDISQEKKEKESIKKLTNRADKIYKWLATKPILTKNLAEEH